MNETEIKLEISQQKSPEFIFVDRMKEEEFKQEDVEMDSSCDSAWNNCSDNLKIETVRQGKTLMDERSLTKTEIETEIQQKAAVKRSKTMPLVTPSMPIVSINCGQAMDDKETQSNVTLKPKRPAKYNYPKKPKMCTVCGE